MNRDTLYSTAVVDLEASPATVMMPDAGGRFMAMQVVNEDHCTVTVVYNPGPHTFTKEQVGTRYLLCRANVHRSHRSVGEPRCTRRRMR